MSMVYDPVTKEFRPRLALEGEYKARAEMHARLMQQATASDFERRQTRRHHQVRRRRRRQDLIFWSVLLTVATLMTLGIYLVNKQRGQGISLSPNPGNPDAVLPIRDPFAVDGPQR